VPLNFVYKAVSLFDGRFLLDLELGDLGFYPRNLLVSGVKGVLNLLCPEIDDALQRIPELG